MSAPNDSRAIHANIVESIIEDFSAPYPTDDDLLKLHAILGPMALQALNLVDNGEVTKINLPNKRYIYQVSSSSGKPYTIHPTNLRSSNPYCPCHAFTYSCLVGKKEIMCKHVLAVKLAEKLGELKITQVDKRNGMTAAGVV